MAIKVELLVDDKGTATIKSFTNTAKREIAGLESQTKSSTSAMSASWSKLGGIIAGVFSAQKVGSLIKETINYSDQLGKLSTRLGINVRDLDKFNKIAEVSDVDLQTLTRSIQRMIKGLGDAERGTGTTAKTLKELGINFKDLIGLKPDEQFLRIAKAIEGIEDPGTKAYYTMEIFGQHATSLLQMFPDLIKNFSSISSVMSNENAAAAAKFNDTLTELKQHFRDLASRLIPVLNDTLQFTLTNFNKFLVIGGLIIALKLPAIFRGIGDSIKYMAEAMLLATGIKGFGAIKDIGMQAASAYRFSKEWQTVDMSGISQSLAGKNNNISVMFSSTIEYLKKFAAGLWAAFSPLMKLITIVGSLVGAMLLLKLAIDKITQAGKSPLEVEHMALRDRIQREMVKEGTWGSSFTSDKFKTEFQRRYQDELSKESTDAYNRWRQQEGAGPSGKLGRSPESEAILEQMEKLRIETLKAQGKEFEAQVAELNLQKQKMIEIVGLNDTLTSWYNAQYKVLLDQKKAKEDMLEMDYLASGKRMQDQYIKLNWAEREAGYAEYEAKVKDLNETSKRLLDTWADLDIAAGDLAWKAYDSSEAAINLRENFIRLEETIVNLGETFQEQLIDNLTEFIMGTKSAKEAFIDLLQFMARELLRSGLKQLMAEIFGTSQGGIFGVLSKLIGGFNWGSTIAGTATGANSMGWLGRQHGGPVSAYKPYMVGEAGPELFMPRTSGSIVPNDQLGRGGRGIVINSPITINSQGGRMPDTKDVEKTATAYRRMLKESVRQILVEEQRPFGLLSRA